MFCTGKKSVNWESVNWENRITGNTFRGTGTDFPYTFNRITGNQKSHHEKLVFVPEYKVAYIALSEAELKKFNFKKGDTEGIVNYALSVGGIDFSAFFSDKDGAIRISFRSKKFDVNKFARAHFSGGGHINAAGAKSELSLKDTVAKFVALLPQYKAELLKK